jgi:hypothetical protein
MGAKKQGLNYKPNFWYKSLFNTRFLNVAILAAICLTGVFYLAQINDMATKGFKMKELEEKQTMLKENIKKTELQVADMQSMQKLEERIGNLNMASVAKVQYVSSTGSVAVK